MKLSHRLGSKIKDTLEAMGITDVILAEKTGVDLDHIRNLVNGETQTTSTKALAAIARVLETTVDDMFTPESKTKRAEDEEPGNSKIVYDYSRLRELAISHYGSLTSFAQDLGVSPRTISRKLNNKTCFKVFEVERIIELLKIPHENAQALFFTTHQRKGLGFSLNV